MNWITKFIKPKIKSLFKKKSSSSEETLWTNCNCGDLVLTTFNFTVNNKIRFTI